MSLGDPSTARPRELTIDAMKIHLLTNLNLLRAEIMNYGLERKLTHALFSDFSKFIFRKRISKETTFFVISINDRLDYLLEIAKNVLSSPNDPERLEYQKFESIATTLIHQSLVKKKLFGLKRKTLG